MYTCSKKRWDLLALALTAETLVLTLWTGDRVTWAQNVLPAEVSRVNLATWYRVDPELAAAARRQPSGGTCRALPSTPKTTFGCSRVRIHRFRCTIRAADSSAHGAKA